MAEALKNSIPKRKVEEYANQEKEEDNTVKPENNNQPQLLESYDTQIPVHVDKSTIDIEL